MADKSIGSAYVDLKVRNDKASQNAAINELSGLANKLPGALGDSIGQATSLGRVFSSYAKSLGGAEAGASALTGTISVGAGAVGAAVGAMAAAVAKTDAIVVKNAESWKDLETQILTINGIAGGGTAEFERFKTAIMDVAASTSWSAEEVGRGMEALVRGGADVEAATRSISVVADLARGQIASMDAMADLLSNTRNQFGLAIEDVEHIADVIAASTASSAQGVSDFTEAMKMAGTTAGSMGQSLERTAAQINTLANVGIKGSMAGSAINALLARISGNETATDELAKLGVNVYDDSGKMKALDDVLNEARQAMQEKGYTEAQQNASWAAIAGTENLKSALALAQTSLNEIEATLKDVDGTAKKQAAAIDSGLKGSQEILASARDAITKQMGEAAAGGLKERTDKITDAVGLAAEVARDTAENIKRFSDASVGFGDIAGDIEILKAELTGAIVSAGASIVEGFKPVIELMHEILRMLADEDKLRVKQLGRLASESRQTRREQTVQLGTEQAKKLFFDYGGKNVSFTKSDGETLKGQAAYDYATNKAQLLTAKQQAGTASDDEIKELDKLREFINTVDDGIEKIRQKAFDNSTSMGVNADADVVKRQIAIDKEALAKNQQIVDALKEDIENGNIKADSNNAYEIRLTEMYSQAIKNISELSGAIAQNEARLNLNETGAVRKNMQAKQPADVNAAQPSETPSETSAPAAPAAPPADAAPAAPAAPAAQPAEPAAPAPAAPAAPPADAAPAAPPAAAPSGTFGDGSRSIEKEKKAAPSGTFGDGTASMENKRHEVAGSTMSIDDFNKAAKSEIIKAQAAAMKSVNTKDLRAADLTHALKSILPDVATTMAAAMQPIMQVNDNIATEPTLSKAVDVLRSIADNTARAANKPAQETANM